MKLIPLLCLPVALLLGILHASPAESTPLLDTNWKFTGFEEIEGDTVSLTAPIEGTTLNLRIREDGKAHGRSGVNQFFGTAKVDEKTKQLSIGKVGLTRMAGPPEAMKQESKFLGKLEDITTFELQGKTLKLIDPQTGTALLFEAE